MKPFAILSLIAAVLTLSACETVEGAGRDLQSAGQTVSQEARQTQAQL
ncbi:entericidin A/B family lipoprotein [Pararhodobacter zhoushanensis]|uniref:Entericidin A/B family lipoprotein n=1 Tax=Pararhodobacter zhoushanensis TaxID=2479545 RepID=A0ABT3GW88_9RHOB|nr:entericidin A/B family lipoprotein [Pararhodobacter zhoushanensis]MCW1931786.1 entericidin A/B family lipoprotein [Pararhodobacter zhoushanensis]